MHVEYDEYNLQRHHNKVLIEIYIYNCQYCHWREKQSIYAQAEFNRPICYINYKF